MASRVSSPILIGRRGELERLVAAGAAAAAGSATTVLVGGEAGIGKTRLITEFASRATTDGSIVLQGGCVSLGDDEGLPFAPIAEALRALARRLDPAALADVVGTAAGELGRLVPELGAQAEADPGSGGRPEWAQTRIFEGLLGLLQRLGDRWPVVLILEDLHWADRSTRDVVAFVARNARTERVLVVATFRSDELNRRHPLRPWLAEMERAPRVERIDLARLKRDELAAQIAAILETSPSEALLDAVVERSDGNPFFAEEILAAGPDRSDAVPKTLRDVLLSRVAALPDEAQRVVGVASVGGRVVDHDLLTAVAGSPSEQLTGAVREAVTAQLLVPHDEIARDAYAFRHALLQEAVYDDLLPSERRGLHAAYAAALAARPTPAGADGAAHLAALAHHAAAAHDLPVSLAAWIGAARASTAAYAFPEAARAYERALELWDAVQPDDRPSDVDEVSLLDSASIAHVLSGEAERGRQLVRLAVERHDATAEPLRAASLRGRLARTNWLVGDVDESLRLLEEATAMLSGLPPTPEGARVTAILAGTLMLRGSNRRAIEIAEQAIAMATAVGAPGAHGHALTTIGVSLAQLGECERAIDLLRQGMAISREVDDVDDIGRSYSNLGSALQICGDVEAAVATSLEGAAWSRRVGMWRGYGEFHETNAAAGLIELGRWSEASEMLARIEAGGTVGVVALSWATNAGPLAVAMGRRDEARRILEAAARIVHPAGDPQFAAPIHHGLIELALDERRHDDAARLVDEALAGLREIEDALLRALLLEDALRVAAERAEIARARRLEGAEREARADGEARLGELDALVAALPSGSGTAAEPAARAATARACASALAGAPDPAAWAAAVDAWTALRRPYPAARARYGQAEAVVAGGGPRREAARLLAEARATAERLGALALVERIDGLARRARLTIAEGATKSAAEPDADDLARAGDADPFRLTERERDVLSLVAQGFTNRRIAEALFISESTAGVHVSNILGKLGVASRVEAAAVAVRLGLVG